MIYTLDTENYSLSLSIYIYGERESNSVCIYIYTYTHTHTHYIYKSLEQTTDPEIDTQLYRQEIFDKVIEAFNEGRKAFLMHGVGPLDSHVQK